LDPVLITETKNRLKTDLAVTNITILIISAVAGYFLAGRTLKPIGLMVEGQNHFVADASHELRTPLTAIKSEIEVNLRNKKMTLAESKILLKSNLEEVNHLQNLTDRLIRSTKYQQNSNGLTLTKFLLTEIVDGAIKKINPLAKSKKINIYKKITNFQITGDKFALTEMLVIFLDNAIKYSPTETEVLLTAKKSDSQLVIQITDKGIGIDKQDQTHLFDRFYRADKSRTNTNVPGYGLGLFIAKQIISQHHGSVKVKSIINKGTTFIISLPINSAFSQN
jgi:signal transduction histidine kinase